MPLAPPESSIIAEAAVFYTPLGWMAVAGAQGRLEDVRIGCADRGSALAAIRGQRTVRLSDGWSWLVERLCAYAEGEVDDFADVRVAGDNPLTFTGRVLIAARQIPYGGTLSYAGLAKAAGSPAAARAVGNAMKANRCPLVIPCHRVVHADGAIGGFSAPPGAALKERLLALERGAAACR